MRPNRYPKQCYLMLNSFHNAGKTCWGTKSKQLLFENMLGFVWILKDVCDCNLSRRLG